jgi:hypothetical protein
VRICACTCTCVCVHLQMQIRICIRICLCIRVCICLCMCVYVYAHELSHIDSNSSPCKRLHSHVTCQSMVAHRKERHIQCICVKCMHICISIYIHIYIYIYICTYVCVYRGGESANVTSMCALDSKDGSDHSSYIQGHYRGQRKGHGRSRCMHVHTSRVCVHMSCCRKEEKCNCSCYVCMYHTRSVCICDKVELAQEMKMIFVR